MGRPRNLPQASFYCCYCSHHKQASAYMYIERELNTASLIFFSGYYPPTYTCTPEFPKQKFLFQSIFILEFSVKHLTFQKFNNFQIFWKLSKKISFTICPHFEMLKFLVKQKVPMFWHHNTKIT